MLSTLINRPCVIVNRSELSELDEHGNPIPSESATETVCELQQQQRTEQGDQGELSDTRWLAIFPAGTLLKTGDVVLDEALTYEVIGDPWSARNPRTQQESHVEATLRRTAGEDLS